MNWSQVHDPLDHQVLSALGAGPPVVARAAWLGVTPTGVLAAARAGVQPVTPPVVR